MSPAVLALSILFVADDAALPSVLVELVEKPGARQATLLMIDDDQLPITVEVADSGGRASLVRADWPQVPGGVSVSPAVDGVIVTFDDAGAWTPLFVSAPPQPVLDAKGRPAKVTKPPVLASTLPWPPPSLPVAASTTLRLFVPAVVDGEVGPATLHGADGLRVAGVALAWRQSFADVGTVAVSSVGADVDASPPTVLVEGPVSAIASLTGDPCAPGASSVLQRLTRSMVGAPVCIAGLVVARLAGTRFGDLPASDRRSHGLVVLQAPPASPLSTVRPATPSTDPGRGAPPAAGRVR